MMFGSGSYKHISPTKYYYDVSKLIRRLIGIMLNFYNRLLKNSLNFNVKWDGDIVQYREVEI